MRFLSVYHTDVGIRKETNQDSVLIKEAKTAYGNVLMAVVCDGMGGLAKGELASAELIRAYADWFDHGFADILYHHRDAGGIDSTALKEALDGIAQNVNRRVGRYASHLGSMMGTTAVVFIIAEGRFYTMNVGDSRICRIDDFSITRLTKDQTYVQREVDAGRMTQADAALHPKRNVLLQCIGAGQRVVPEFGEGVCQPGELYMLCSDGFRHVVSEDEFLRIFAPEKMTTEKVMHDAAVYCTELVKSRKEKDNISVILIRICQD